MYDLEEMLKHIFNGTEVQVYRVDENGWYQLTSSEPATMENWKLIDLGSGEPVPVGEILRSAVGDEYVFTGGRPPHKPSSTGRVYVKEVEVGREQEYFPSVFNCEWRYVKS